MSKRSGYINRRTDSTNSDLKNNTLELSELIAKIKD